MIFEKKVIGIYKGMAYTRYDDDGLAYYFSADDFDGLHAETYEFKALAGHTLNGNFYYYDGFNPDRLMVFDHGIGGGHRSYMKEIEMLCRHGFRVFAYDHTGCMESGGENTNGMAQSLCDLNDCITSLRADERFKEPGLSVMGHSWGGFSTLNITALHPEISHIVVMSGFVSVKLLVTSYFQGVLKGYRKAILELERRSNPKFFGFNAADTLSNSDVKALLIYSDNDKMCGKMHYDTLKSALASKSNIRFLLEHNKGHNPNYTEKAVQYLGEYVNAKTALARNKNITENQKKEFVASYDWDAMTAQDEKVWAEIFDCLDS